VPTRVICLKTIKEAFLDSNYHLIRYTKTGAAVAIMHSCIFGINRVLKHSAGDPNASFFGTTPIGHVVTVLAMVIHAMGYNGKS
jgi:hypothetical protein